MKNIKRITTSFIPLVWIMIVAAFVNTSCTNNENRGNTGDTAEIKNDKRFSGYNEQDAQFLVDAASIHLQEIRIGQLAQKNATMNELKELGKTMENYHTKALYDLGLFAKSKSINLPTSLSDTINDNLIVLSKLTGNDFDVALCKTIIYGHNIDFGIFEKAQTESVDTLIRKLASEYLPELHAHLNEAVICQNKLEKKIK